MSTLVTGAAGFIGSHVARHLIQNSYNVVAIDKLGYCSTLANVPVGAIFEFGDLTDSATTRRLFKAYDIKQVVNCAANSHVDHSFKSPFEFVRNNVTSTQVLLDASVEFGVEKFVQFSTDEVYGPTNKAAVETSPLNPTNPYSSSKACCDLIAQTYQRSFRLPVVITRCNNVYGPRQFPEKIIPKFIMQTLNGQPCVLHGSGTHKRTYVYATDVARAVRLVLEKGKDGEIYNMGSEDEFSNFEVAQMLIGKLGTGNIEYGEDRVLNDIRYLIDYSKIRDLGWSPQTKFPDGLEKTINWYRRHGTDNWGPCLKHT